MSLSSALCLFATLFARVQAASKLETFEGDSGGCDKLDMTFKSSSDICSGECIAVDAESVEKGAFSDSWSLQLKTTSMVMEVYAETEKCDGESGTIKMSQSELSKLLKGECAEVTLHTDEDKKEKQFYRIEGGCSATTADASASSSIAGNASSPKPASQTPSSGSDGDSPKVTGTGSASGSKGVGGSTGQEASSKAKNETAQQEASGATSEEAPGAANASGTQTNVTTVTTTTYQKWVRKTTTTTIYTPAPADVTQVWMSHESPCFVECKDHLEKVFGSGPLPATDSATFAIKMMASCRVMIDFLACVREKTDQCPPGGEVAQSVEFYTAMCMCPCRDAFVRGLRKAHNNPDDNMCTSFEDFAGCAACSSQREECDYALVDTKTEVAGRLLEAASACPTASCTGYLWQWQPKSGAGAVGEAAEGAAGSAGRTSGTMFSTALCLLLGFGALVA